MLSYRDEGSDDMELFICILIVLLVILWRKLIISEKEFDYDRKKYLENVEEHRKKADRFQKDYNAANAKNLSYSQEIAELKKQITEQQKEIDFYKNIEEDSGRLNVKDHHIEVTDDMGEKDIKKLLDEEQLLAFKEMEYSTDNFFITGKAGTGKSYLLNAFRTATEKKNIILAPTGIAALHVNGATLHSTFGFDNLVNLDIDLFSYDTIKMRSDKKEILKEVSTIIIDEISMVRSDIFEKMDRILKIINRSEKPFGGKQIILFGDLFQLPPVVTKKEESKYLVDKFGGVHFFCTDAYKKGNFRFIELTINHRQKEDEEYFSLLNRIRIGKTTADDIEMLNSRVVRDNSIFDRFTTLLPTKNEVEKLNQYHLDQLNSDGFTYQAKILLNKKNNQNVNLEFSFPIVNVLYLKKGALVMMVSNDPEHRWVNGTLGIVSELSKDKIAVAIDKRTYYVNPCEFTEQEVSYEDGSIIYEDVLKVMQYPIVPAYAITIHKSQGQTYQNIVCDIDRCFANGQAYVALSRCASLKGLYIKKEISGASILVDRCVLDFYQDHLNQNEKN